MDFYKARVVYGENGVETVEYAPYSMRKISSLKVVEDNTIVYDYKSTDRVASMLWLKRKGAAMTSSSSSMDF